MRHSKPVRLETAPTVLPFGRHCFQLCLCGAVRNRTYRVGVNTARLETAATGPDKSGSKPGGESVYLFLEFTIAENNTHFPIDFVPL